MKRVVLDANVFVSALICRAGPPARVLQQWEEERFAVVISEAILQELDHVLHYPRLYRKYKLSEERISRFLGLLRTQCVLVEPTIKLSVIKRDGSRVPYNRDSIEQGILRAAYKRPIPSERIEQVVDEVEEYLTTTFEKEVSSQTIGERIAEVLRRVDKVAYVRFASVYRQFKDVGDFIDEAQDVIQRSASDIPGQQDLFEGNTSS